MKNKKTVPILTIETASFFYFHFRFGSKIELIAYPGQGLEPLYPEIGPTLVVVVCNIGGLDKNGKLIIEPIAKMGVGIEKPIHGDYGGWEFKGFRIFHGLGHQIVPFPHIEEIGTHIPLIVDLVVKEQ